jgi:hypothetical protein
MADETELPNQPQETGVKPYDPANLADLMPKYAPAEAHLVAERSGAEGTTEQPAEATTVAAEERQLSNLTPDEAVALIKALQAAEAAQASDAEGGNAV